VPRYPSDMSDAEWQHGSVLNGKDGQEQETLVLQQFRRRF